VTGRPAAAARAATLALALATAWGGAARAQAVELAPFAGYQFGGGLTSPVLGRDYTLAPSFHWGGAVDFAISENWRAEVYYSRQDSALEPQGGGASFDVVLERFEAGIMEQKGTGDTRFFGTLLLGASRFVPKVGDYDTDTHFSGTLALGFKRYFGQHLGLRAEARAHWISVESGAGAICSNGSCIFAFSGSGIWQGDFSGGVILAF
jgi:hypothetical protein